MAINKRKILASAQKNLQKGALDKALRDYQAILEADPRDANVRLKVGDLLLRRGQRQEAFAAYLKVADQFMREGFDAKAVALYKQITKIDPSRVEVYIPLADLYQRLGLVSEAMTALQTAADHYHREGRKSEALDLLRRMAGLDPTNTTSRLKIAELLRQAGREDEALVEYEETAAELSRQGDWETQITVLERVLELEPKRGQTLKELVAILLEQDRGERAEPFARRLQEADPAAPEGHELLASVYGALGRDEDATAVYRQLADLYRTRGDEERARDILQRLVPAEPLDFGAMAEDGQDDAFTLDLEDLSSEPPLEQDGSEEEGDAAAIDSDEGFLEESGGELRFETDVPDAPPADSAPAEPTPSSPPGDSPQPPREPETQPVDAGDAAEAGVDQRLAEAAVYLRYGKHQRAIASLLAILAAEPDHPLALARLVQAYVRSEQIEEAVRVLVGAAESARSRGDSERFDALCEKIHELDPRAADALSAIPEAPEKPHPRVEPDAATSPALDEIEIDIDDDLGDDEIPSSDEALDLSPTALEADADESDAGSSTTPRHIVEGLEEANFFFDQGLYEESEAIYQRILQVAPSHPQALLRMGEIAAARGKDPGDTTDTIRNPAEGAATAADVETTVPEDDAIAAGAAEPALESPHEGDEASHDEALAVSGTPEPHRASPPGLHASGPRQAPAQPGLRPRAPGLVADEGLGSIAEEARVDEASDETDPGLDTGQKVASLANEPPGQALFDLAAELHEALQECEPSEPTRRAATDEDGFQALFRDFKRGVSQTLGDEDRETHYDLGIAYREMGLLEDAVGEFRAAADLPARRLDALYMMSLCDLDLGRPNDAASHLEQALAGDEVPPERQVALRFHLARAYEAFGDRARALETYRQVADLDADFQDVLARIAALESAETAPTEEAASAQASEEYESFDDLIAEADDVPRAEAPEPYESFEDLMAEVEELDTGETSSPPAPSETPDPPPRRRKISFV